MKPLLPPVKSKDSGKICVVIDLDETLVHSSFKVGLVKDGNQEPNRLQRGYLSHVIA